MRWTNGLTWQAKKRQREKWHKWFAWYPVTVYLINNERKFKVWLEVIERKGAYCNITLFYDPWWEYEYRLPQRRM